MTDDPDVPLSMAEPFLGFPITLRAVRMGADLCVAIFGGEQPHIGAVAVAQPRPSLRDPARTSASASVITLPGHKEDLLAHGLAGRLAAATGGAVSLSCGIHYDDLSADDIAQVGAVVERLGDRLLQALGHPSAARDPRPDTSAQRSPHDRPGPVRTDQ